MPRVGCWVAQGLLAESSGSDLPWDRGQGFLFLLGFSCECLQLFSALHPQCPFSTHYCTEQFCIPPIVKTQVTAVGSLGQKCRRCMLQQSPGRSQENRRLVLMQQESTSPLVSYSKAKTKVGFVQLGGTAKPCQGGRKKMWKFSYFVLDLIPWNRVHMRVFHRKNTTRNWKCRTKILGSDLHLSSNTALLEGKRRQEEGKKRKQNRTLSPYLY